VPVRLAGCGTVWRRSAHTTRRLSSIATLL
jgi:hypothetical protein